MASIDFTELVDKTNAFTSNISRVIRGGLDALDRGEIVDWSALRNVAEQADRFCGNEDDPVPAPPEGGVPVAEHLEDDATAAQVVGVVTPA